VDSRFVYTRTSPVSVQHSSITSSRSGSTLSRPFDSCHSCLRRSCTLSGAVHPTVRSRTEKADAMTFVSQFDPQISTWFDYSTEDSSRTVSDLVRRLRSALYIQCRIQATQQFLSAPRSVVSPSSTMSNSIDATVSQWCLRFQVQQCRTPSTVEYRFHLCPRHFQSSTMSNSVDQLYEVQSRRTPSTLAQGSLPVNNVELHRHVVMVPPFHNVELHRQQYYRHDGDTYRQQCRTPSTVQSVAGIDHSVFSLGIAVEL